MPFYTFEGMIAKQIFLAVLLMIGLNLYSQQSETIHGLGRLAPANVDSFTYAVIGDYGDDSQGEQLVADMVKGWKPAFIITTGDNDYEDKNHKDIETNISKYYQAFINPDLHSNCFFPCLGNHDQSVMEKKKVLDAYFELFPFLRQAKDYDFTWGPIHFYSINSGTRFDTGTIYPNVLINLKRKIAAEHDPFHIVFFHHPQYSSAYGANPLPDRLADYGIDAVLNGHIHYYERMSDTINHIEYITIGCSGRNNDTCANKLANNKDIVVRTCKDHQNGAVKVKVTKIKQDPGQGHWQMKFYYYNAATPQTPADSLTLVK
jgi:Calcineurin-like phosphoesterase